MTENSSATLLTDFEQFVQEKKRTLQRQYDRSINRDLSSQQWQDLFIRNVTATLQQAYDDSLAKLQQMPFTPGEPGLCARLLQPFDGFIDDLLQYALQKHRTSCALSNFSDEHKPSRDYIAATFDAAVKDWIMFVARVEATFS